MKIHLTRQKEDHRSEKGQSLAELAVGVTVLFTMLAGIIDLGLAFVNFVAMRDAAQEGAIYGSLHPNECAQIENYVRESAKTLLDDELVVSVFINDASCSAATIYQACSENTIRVVVSQPHYPITMPLIGALFETPNELNLQAEIKDTILTPLCPVSAPYPAP